MAIQDDNTVLCKGDLKAYHEKILPYLGGNFMLGTNVSDYYSTDEKIVGVWIDGKPVYQKVLDVTTPSSATDTTVYTFPESVLVIDMAGYNLRSDGGQMPIQWEYGNNQQQITCYAVKHANDTIISMSCSLGMDQNRPVRIICKYVKDSDTANSAVTTPGCYNINFPNTWPANQEIFFGNGLYGQRFTGTITASINTRHIFDLTNTGTNRQPRIISCGGWWCRETNNAALNIGQNDNNQESSSILVGPAGTISLETKSANTRTNSPYEVWVTYIK